jgi:hypothetical protein
VAAIVKDLKADLGIADVPFLAGELRGKLNRSTNESCCWAHNPYVATLAKTIPNGHLVSSQGLDPADDPYHFTSPGYREFGKRYAATMLAALAKSSGTSGAPSRAGGWHLDRGVSGPVVRFGSTQDRIEVRDLRGNLVARGSGREIRLPESHGALLLRAQGEDGVVVGMLPISP